MNTVKHLRGVNFRVLPLEEKLKMKTMGRPLPDLKISQTVSSRATWVKRCESDDEAGDLDKETVENPCFSLSEIQKEKLSYFFAHVFDMDRDDVIALQDIEGFTERLRHFAEWSSNSGEYLILQQVQQGIIETFIYPLKLDAESSESADNYSAPKDLDRLFLSIEEWLKIWDGILDKIRNFYELPLWLQYFPKVIFAAINKSGSGCLSREELGAFYSSVMGYPTQKLNKLVSDAYKAMTGGGDYKLSYDCYRLCFANFLFARHPNGPGQYMFGASQRAPPPLFPIDYSAMNTPPEDIEPYDGSLKSNRSSVIV